MARPKAKAPARSYHISGQSIVRIGGRDFYLGKHDSPESIARYAVLIGIYQAGGLVLPEDFDIGVLDERASTLLGQARPEAIVSQQANLPILVKHVTAAYRIHADNRYVNNPQEHHRLHQICDSLDKHAGNIEANDYGPLLLQQQRQRWVTAGLSRVYCNRLTNAVVRIFKYSVSQELVGESTWSRLKSVESLRTGQTEAPETNTVKPVSIDVVRATAEHLPPGLKAMIRVHLGTGMRPNELCRIRPCDIDRSGDVWVYRPAKHKTAHRGKTKAVPILGDAREALTDYLNRSPESFCFSPAESMTHWYAKKRAARKSKVQPSQQSRAVANPRKVPGDHYTPTSYRQSIQRAAKRAGVEKWHPYQMRHLAITMVRDALGIEAAQAFAGHSNLSMTEHYAKQTEAKAIEASKAAPKL